MKQFGLKSILALDDDSQLSGILTETDFIAESEIISERSEHSSTVGTEGDKWSWDSTSVLYIEKNHLKLTFPKMVYCTDNAAMIAVAGYFKNKYDA